MLHLGATVPKLNTWPVSVTDFLVLFSFPQRVTPAFPAPQALVERKVPKDPVVRLDLLDALVKLDLLAHPDLPARRALLVPMDLL